MGRQIKCPSGEITEFRDIANFYQWALDFREKSSEPIIISAIGRPTAPVYPPLREGSLLYWDLLPADSAIEYGDLQGEKEYRNKIAKALTSFYETEFSDENILFTVGGRIGLSAISYMISALMPDHHVVAPLPTYPDYRGLFESPKKPKMIYVDTLDHARLTADILQSHLKNVSPEMIGAFIFCVPNNPMGYCLNAEEWQKIASILESYPNAAIILDEAYAELVFHDEHVSLVTVAPHLKKRIILLRSATKGFSASGERMAILATWNPVYMEKIREYHFMRALHSPKSSQFAYSYAMERVTKEDLKKLANFYEPQVRLVENLLKATNFLYNLHPVEASFYVLANFKEYLGRKISPKTAPIYPSIKDVIEDDVDIAFHFLAEYGLAIMPMSLFGVDPQKGLLRITCSFTPDEQTALAEKIYKIRQDLSE